MRFTSRASGPIAIVAILLVGGVATHRSVVRDRQPLPESRALVLSLLGSARPFEGRLFGMEYLPFDPDQEWRPDPRALARVAKDLRQKAKAGEEKVLAEIALVEALGGDLDRAILRLDEAARGEGAEAWIWSDLVVLYLARYQRNSDSTDLLKALDASSRAQDGEEAVPEAVFNLGLVLEKLFMLDPAREAWERGKLDRDPQWAAEAQGHLDELDRFDPGKHRDIRVAAFSRAPQTELEARAAELVQDFPQAAREHAEGELLRLWAADQQAGRREAAARHLEKARAIAQHLSARGEHMAADAIAAIDRAAAVGVQELEGLARQHALYFEGASDAREGACKRALPLLFEARRGLEEGNSPLSRWASLRAAICEYRQFRYDDAQRTLWTLVGKQDTHRYPALLGAAHRMLGLIQGIEGDPVASLAEYRLATDAFERIGERENRAALSVLVAEISRILGDQDSAWKSLWSALQEIPTIEEPRNRYSVLSEAAVLTEEMDLPGAALRFMDASLQVTEADAVARAACLRRRAELCARIGFVDTARDSLAEARGMLSAIGDAEGRLALEGDLLAVESGLLSRESPTRALGELTRAIETHEGTSYREPLARLYMQRARAHRELGQVDLARTDLGRAVELVEMKRENLSQEELDSFLVENRAVYDEMARVQLLLGKPEQALAATERGRGLFPRELLAQGMSWLQKEIPESAALVEYALLEGDLRAWVVRATRIDSIDLEAGEPEVGRSIKRLYEVIDSKGSLTELREVSGDLFDQLIRPLESKLFGVNRLVFVPDGALHQVPFVALWDRTGGRFLLEDFTITVSPSAGLHAAAARRKKALSVGNSLDILVVGNPVLDRRAWPSLTDLPEAGREATEIFRLYSKAKVLSGEEATPEAFLANAPQSDVIHVASHALANEAHPELSMLALSPSRESGGSGALYARELMELALPKTRLVFLAACETAGGGDRRAEGIVGIVRPFLLAGVPSAIGTLWSVDDAAASKISKGFHKLVREGDDPVAALRAVQLEVIAKGGGDFSWAAFELLGA